jgi:hypothetical protein
MEILTKYPVLIDPTKEQKDKIRFTPNTVGYPGDLQTVEVAGLIIKGNTPVFEGDHQITRNEFIYLPEVKADGNVLTPMDEWLYSERNISEGALGFGEFENWGDVFANADGDTNESKKEKRRKARAAAKAKKDASTPGNGEPSKDEQDAKAKEGKFWNVLKGGWDNFTKSASGQIILDSATNYISNRLGGGSSYAPMDTTPPTTTPDPKADESDNKTSKYLMIGGAVVLVGIIIYAFSKAGKE